MESFTDHISYLRKTAVRLRIDLLQMLHNAGSGHLGGSLSIIDILVALYYGRLSYGPVLRFDAKIPQWEDQDYFVLSKGHASAAWYTVLADLEFFPKEELLHFRKINSLLQAYPFQKIPGVPLTSGSAGVGLSQAVGLALALKMDKQQSRVLCLVGDGELQNGDLWEAALLASHYKLDNLTLIVDFNGLQMDGSLRSVVGVDPVSDKFESFGWKYIPVSDGHNFEDLLLGFEKAYEVQRRPAVILARTVKGKGVPFAENKSFYHAEVLSDQEMAEAIPYLQRQYDAFESVNYSI
jgi:transketolase